MTDLENRLWLCEQVIDVKQQGGMSLERALAMLHKLTELESHEPYLSEQPTVPAVTWDYGEPLVDQRVEELYAEATAELINSWPDITVSPLEATYDDGLGPLPAVAARVCAVCDTPLERRPKESYADYEARETDSKRCAARLREERKREAREEVAA